jgi:hypothetical protein
MYMLNQRTILLALANAMIWSLTYYFIRRQLNPANTDLEKFKADAYYGGLSAFIAGLLKEMVKSYI